jgi:hypothetical protein
MSDQDDYIFKIDDMTPETMPFGRLLEYYAEVKKMIGTSDHVHLIEVRKSSHATAFKVDRDHLAQVDERVVQVSQGTAPKPSLRARDTINQMLREDSTSGEFLSARGGNVIAFPGTKADEDVLYSVRQAVNFSGELYHIAGGKNDVRIRISTDAYGVVFCKASREMAKHLRGFLFEEVKVTGMGAWKRMADGAWTVSDVTITDYLPTPDDNLRATVNKLRKLDIDWPDDPIGLIEDIDEKGAQVH